MLGSTMCRSVETVKDALRVGTDIEATVCGKLGEAFCPFRLICGYQLQKGPVGAVQIVSNV
jgi:hypothetical protein